MRIELEQLEPAGGRFAHRYEPEEIVLDEEHARLTKPPEVSGHLKRERGQVSLRGKITTEAEVDCDRCLKSVLLPVEVEFDVTYVTVQDYEKGMAAAALQEEDLGLSIFDGETIDIDELVREQVLLALPVRALCGEECKGLCPTCGADLNSNPCACESREVDPRWAGLKAMIKDE